MKIQFNECIYSIIIFPQPREGKHNGGSGSSPFPTITFNDEERRDRRRLHLRGIPKIVEEEEEVIEMYDDTAQERVGSIAGC